MHSMTESESEAETLERLEAALRKIAELARLPKRSAPEIDRAALLHSLDMLISRLRGGLTTPQTGHTE
jgi:response regulator RpfG family c-di-GMP phosphodiesterase